MTDDTWQSTCFWSFTVSATKSSIAIALTIYCWQLSYGVTISITFDVFSGTGIEIASRIGTRRIIPSSVRHAVSTSGTDFT